MASINTLLKLSAGLAVCACIYQSFLSNVIFVAIGYNRHIQPLKDFPYQCRRIDDPRLSSCEDMWLSDSTRQLFLACSDPLTRKDWMPNMAALNHSARSLDDAVIAMDIDKPTSNGKSFNYRVLKTPGYPPPTTPNDDRTLHLVGLTGNDSPQTIELFLVNAKPSRSPDGTILDNTSTGANSTIEKFITGPAATTMKHVSTYAHPLIATPNNVATAPGMKGFYITNDHGPHKTGLMHTLSQVLGLGDVTYCDTSTTGKLYCGQVASGINFPNGLLYHPAHDLLYVPSAANGNIHVYRPGSYNPETRKPTLTKVHEIKVPYPIDNLSLEPNTGDIYAACIPKMLALLAASKDPMGSVGPPTTGMRVKLVRGLEEEGREMEYEVTKVVEDVGGEGAVLPGATTVVKDGRTGRLFLSGELEIFLSAILSGIWCCLSACVHTTEHMCLLDVLRWCPRVPRCLTSTMAPRASSTMSWDLLHFTRKHRHSSGPGHLYSRTTAK